MTGKTTTLVDYFVKAAKKYGPKKVAYTTYTKTAAEEARTRVAKALGIRGNAETLKREIPYVGTTHSLCFAQAGIRPDQVVDGKNLKSFCTSMGLKEVPSLSFDPAEFEDGSWTTKINELAVILKAHAAARNRGVPVREVLADLVMPTQMLMFPADYVERVGRRYEEWKADTKHYDYEDMLIVGREKAPPVRALIADEQQDNSPLMWSVIDRWSESMDLTILGGDYYQAIFGFMGATPELFMNHPGKWIPLMRSYRVSNSTAEYSRAVLRRAGWEPKTLWEGVGGTPVDGTTLYLARTHNLVRKVESELMEAGTPFTSIKGFSTWTSAPAEAYRMLAKLKRGGTVSTQQIPGLIKGLAQWQLPRGAKAQADRMSDRDVPMDRAEVEKLLGMPLDRVSLKAQAVADYMERVERTHGYGAILLPPKTRVGTIHAAKGREADRVCLIADWDFLPSKVAATPGYGAKREACVSYVAVTRHRSQLEILEKGWSATYNFPPRVKP